MASNLSTRSLWDLNCNSSQENLIKECANHLYLGHWELFRATLMTILSNNANLKTEILRLLKSVYYFPEKYCNGSNKLSSPVELLWCCAKLYETVTDDKLESLFLLRDASFRDLLYRALPFTTPELVKELYQVYRYFTDSDQNQPLQLSSECQKCFKDLCRVDPEIGVAILTALLEVDTCKTERLDVLRILFDGLDYEVSLLEMQAASIDCESSPCPATKNNESKSFQLLLHISDYLTDYSKVRSFDTDGFNKEVHNLVRRLWHLSERDVFTKRLILNCMMCQPNMTTMKIFYDIDNKMRNLVEPVNRGRSVENFLQFFNTRQRKFAIKEIFLYAITNKVHFLETFVISSVELLCAGEQLLVNSVLSNPAMSCLKPLIFLIAWSKVRSVLDAVRLSDAHDLLFNNASNDDDGDPYLKEACQHLVQKTRLVLDALDRPSWNTRRSLKNARTVVDIMANLLHDSTLQTLNKCYHLSNMDRDEVYEALSRCTTMSLREEERRDHSVLSAFYVIYGFFQVVLAGKRLDERLTDLSRMKRKSSVDESQSVECYEAEVCELQDRYEEDVVQALKKIRDGFKSLRPLNFRIELLEDAFSLLFLTYGNIDERNSSNLSTSFSMSSSSENEECDDDDEKFKPKTKKKQSKDVGGSHHAKRRSSELTSSGNTSSRSAGTSGSGHLHISTRFLLNECLVRDILRCLQQCVFDASTAKTVVSDEVVNDEVIVSCSIPERLVSQHLSRLSQYMSEAIWRLQLVTSNEFLRNEGTFPVEELIKNSYSNIEYVLNFYSSVPCDDSSDDVRPPGKSRKRNAGRSGQILLQTVANLSVGSPSVISRMLCQNRSLLNLCLHQNDLVKAAQVVKMFGMESSSMATEVEFATHYKDVVRRLSKSVTATTTSTTQHRSSRKTRPGLRQQFSAWNSVVEAARAGADAAEALVADELLALHKVPVLNVAPENQFVEQWLPCPVDWRALARADLALVACSRAPACRNLLEAALSASSQSRVQGKVTSSKGIVGLLQDSASLLMTTGDEWMKPPCVRSCLLNGMWPLSSGAHKKHVESWRLLFDTISKLKQMLSMSEIGKKPRPDHLSGSSGSSSSATTSSLPLTHNPVSVLCQKLSKVSYVHSCLLSEEQFRAVSNADDAKVPAYLAAVDHYAKNVAEISSHVLTDSVVGQQHSNYFTIFDHSPSKLLQQLLSDDSARLSELEIHAKLLGVDLLQVIVAHCCPYIPTVNSEKQIDENQNVPTIIRPCLLTYVREHCWLAAVLLQAFGCTADDVAMSEEGDALECASILYPVLHRFLEHRTAGDPARTVSTFSASVSAERIRSTFDRLIAESDFAKALDYLDSWECRSADVYDVVTPLRDLVLSRLAIDGLSRPRPPWSYGLQIRDSMKRVYFVLEHYKEWSSSFGALLALNACVGDPEVDDDLRRDCIREKRRVKLYSRIYDEISKGNVTAWNEPCCTWQHVAGADPFKLLNQLFQDKFYEQIVEWNELHDVDKQLQLIVDDSRLLLSLGSSRCNRSAIQKCFACVREQPLDGIVVDQRQRIFVCQRLLDVKQSEAFILQLMNPSDSETKLSHRKIGAKILMCIAEGSRSEYLELVPYPHFLVEQLLIDIKVESLRKVFQHIKDDIKCLDDEMDAVSFSSLNTILEIYAYKAVDFRVVQTLTVEKSRLNMLLPTPSDVRRPFVVPLKVPVKNQWIPDASVTHCMVCAVEQFSMFNRRHHCRRCGRVVCWSCSQRRMTVEGYGDLAVRVCDNCNEQSAAGSPHTLENRLKARFRETSPDDARQSGRSPFLRRNSSCESEQSRRFAWKLTSDDEHNVMTRDEFSYEQAPNVSLCLSIMDLHYDQHRSGLCLLNLADDMFRLLQPLQFGKPNPEIDYNLVISMIKSVLLSAKVKFSKSCDSDGVSRCDLLLGLADLLSTLVEANCKHLIPVGDLKQNDVIRRLRDRLILEERWTLAVDVSTKGGLDVAGVWSAWGLACLRSGQYRLARDKLSLCLQRLKDQNKTKQVNSLLKQILGQLESVREMPVNRVGGQSTVAAGSSMHRLRNITEGIFQEVQKNFSPSKLHPHIHEECLFYINTYGTHATHLAFCMRNGHWRDALCYTLEKKCAASVFVEEVALPAVKRGQLLKLLSEMKAINSSLKKWATYLALLCRHLERQNYLHSLYDLQLFLKDYVRAAFTCVMFFVRDAKDYDELHGRLHYLASAKQHLEVYQQNANVASSFPQHSTAKSMSTDEVQRYLRSISIQTDVTNFLNGKTNCGDRFWVTDTSSICSGESSRTIVVDVPGQSTVLTVFDDAKARANLACAVILAGSSPNDGFQLASRIIREFKLHVDKVYNLTVKRLVELERFESIPSFVSCLLTAQSPELTAEACDNILLKAVIFALSLGTDSYAIDSIIKLLRTDKIKIEACIVCGKLKSAYLIAVKHSYADVVQRILMEATKAGQPSVKAICEKWLALKQKTL